MFTQGEQPIECTCQTSNSICPVHPPRFPRTAGTEGQVLYVPADFDKPMKLVDDDTPSEASATSAEVTVKLWKDRFTILRDWDITVNADSEHAGKVTSSPDFPRAIFFPWKGEPPDDFYFHEMLHLALRAYRRVPEEKDFDVEERLIRDICTEYCRFASSQTASLREEFQAIIERERTEIGDAVNALEKVIRERDWLAEGRGPYEWDDDTWHKEFEATASEIKAAIEPLHKIQRDLTNCPTTWERVLEARQLKRRAEFAESQVTALRSELEALKQKGK